MKQAVQDACAETGLDAKGIPAECPFTSINSSTAIPHCSISSQLCGKIKHYNRPGDMISTWP
jgi:hypothetical protein